jgi:hypothetical protein
MQRSLVISVCIRMNYKKISKIKGPEIKDSWFKDSLNT